MKDCWTFSFETPTIFPIKIMKGKRTFATRPLNRCVKRMSFPLRMVKTRSNPPPNMTRTKIAKKRLYKKGKEGWIFLSPISGTYQRRKMKKERIRQVRTSNPMKILFLGVGSKGVLQNRSELGAKNGMPRPPKSELMIQ